MNKMLITGCAVATAFAAVAMPTKQELTEAQKPVEEATKADLAAVKAGRKTAKEVADSHLALAAKAENQAEKYLYYQGAFKLYARSGEYDLAAEALDGMKREVKDVPPEVIIELAGEEMRFVADEKAPRLLAILEDAKRTSSGVREQPQMVKDRTTVKSIIDGMIKVPGRDYWLSETELTQGQWEAVIGNNPSKHKGANLPVENVSRDDCDVFLEKLNQMQMVRSSGFEFRLPALEEWKYAAWAGSAGQGSWIKPGVVGNVLDMAWVRENSSNRTHAVASKVPNAFGFYDMLGNVWEWLDGEGTNGRGHVKGCHFNQVVDRCNWNQNVYIPKSQRNVDCGLRLAAHIQTAGNEKQGEQIDGKEKVGDYVWSYRVSNGEATIMAEEKDKDGKIHAACAISPKPTGLVTIPATLGGSKVSSIGYGAFKGCSGMSSVTIPFDVKNIGPFAFEGCSGLTSLAIPDGVKTIENCVFAGCGGLKSVMIPSSVTTISDAAFIDCGGLTSITIPPTVKEIRTQVFWGCRNLKSVTIPASVEKIGWASFIYCGELKEIGVEPGNQWFTSVDGALYTKDMTELVACPNALTSLTIPSSVKKLRDAAIISCSKLESLTIPEGVTDIGWQAIKDCGSLKTVTIPSTVRGIAEIAFCNCGSLTSVTIPAGVASIGKRAFENCVALTSVTMLGERPEVPDNVFPACSKLTAIHVPAKAKSWSGMKEWQGIPLVFDAK